MSRRAGALFQPLVVETRLRGMSKPTAKIITTQAMLAVHRTGSDLMFPPRKPRQKLSFNVQMLRRTRSQCACRLVDAYQTRPLRGMQAPQFNALWWCGSCRRDTAYGH
jgi:hypothetical protein